ncbi:hypothetical protein AwEntero_08240 [Enterobacterales bacterium]|nr:hypothetical protein AwEntero_08240 [Enterobacterales bacterium]
MAERYSRRSDSTVLRFKYDLQLYLKRFIQNNNLKTKKHEKFDSTLSADAGADRSDGCRHRAGRRQ